MKVCLLAGGEPRSVRDLTRRFRDRGLDVQYVWLHDQRKFPGQLPASIDVVVNLRDTCTHVVSAHADELVHRARLAGRDVTYVLTSRRAAKWEAALDAAGFKVPDVQAEEEVREAPPLPHPPMERATEPPPEQTEPLPEPPTSTPTVPPTHMEENVRHNKKHKSPRRAFTEAERTEIKELLLSGERVLDIAELYDCSDWMVYNVAKKYDIKPRELKKQMRAQGIVSPARRPAPPLPPELPPEPPEPPVPDWLGNAAHTSVYPLPPIARCSICEAEQQLKQEPQSQEPQSQEPKMEKRDKPTDEEWAAFLRAQREGERQHEKQQQAQQAQQAVVAVPVATCTQADLARARWLLEGVAMGMIKVV